MNAPDYWKQATRELSMRDPVIRKIAPKSRGLMLRSRGDAFNTLARSIVGQQISVKAADSVWQKLIAAVSEIRPEIVHCHAPALIPFGLTKIPLRPVYHNSFFVGEGVPVFEIREAGGDTNMLVETPELGRALAKTLGNKPAVLMRGHGAVIVGKSIIETVARSVYLEVNARVQAQAMAMGARITYLDEGEVKKRSADPDPYGRAWELWKRQAAR